jgi:hypothetical protein
VHNNAFVYASDWLALKGAHDHFALSTLGRWPHYHPLGPDSNQLESATAKSFEQELAGLVAIGILHVRIFAAYPCGNRFDELDGKKFFHFGRVRLKQACIGHGHQFGAIGFATENLATPF